MPGVVGEVLGQPGAAAADVEQPRAGREVPRDVAPVARLLVPVEVAHARRAAYDRAGGAAPATSASTRCSSTPACSGGPETYLRGLVPALARRASRSSSSPSSRRAAAPRALRATAGRDFARDRRAARATRASAARRLCGRAGRCCRGSPRAARRRRRCTRSASTGPVAPLDALRRHAARRHVLPDAHVRRGHDARRCGGRHARAARSADALIAGLARPRATRSCARARPRPGALRRRAARRRRGRPARAGGPRRECATRLGLDGRRVVLCVGAMRPHKNQELLVAALAAPARRRRARARRPRRAATTRRAARARRRARRRGPRARSPATSPTPSSRRCGGSPACAAFPTRAEGFGLPVLEAMRRGVPVACSDLPVLREVGGDVAALLRPATTRPRAARRDRAPRWTTRRRGDARPRARPRASPGRRPRAAPTRPTSARCA